MRIACPSRVRRPAGLSPRRYPSIASSHPLRSIVDRIFVAVRGGAESIREAWGDDVIRRPGYRAALTEVSVALNAALAAFTLRQELRGKRAADLEAVYGIYDLATRRVADPAADPAGDAVGTRLADAPSDSADFGQLGGRVARSEYIRDLLEQT